MEKDKIEIKINKNTLWVGATIILAILFVISLATGGFGIVDNSPTGTVVVNPPSVPSPSDPPVEQRISVDTDDDPFIGKGNAELNIIEFSDYQCPFCRKFWTETLPLIKSEYINAGKVKLVYRDFPLINLHPTAQFAAEAAECIKEQGGDEAYFKMHDKIFSEQNILDGGDPIAGPVRGTVQFGVTELKQWARDISYNIDTCLDSGKFRSEVQKDIVDGNKAGVTGTPSFFIGNNENGYIQIGGAQPFAVFQQVINNELS